MLLLLATAVAHNCRHGLERDCNAPHVFTDMTITANATTPINIMASKNWNASGMDGPVREGLRLVRRFLGHTEPTRVFLIAPGGTDADYADLKASYCAYISDERTQCMGSLLATAKGGGGTYQVGGRYLDPADRCSCDEIANPGVPLIMSPRSDLSASGGLSIAAHEYVHTWQKAMAGPLPVWWMEGGAVQIACLVGPQATYSACFQDIVAKVRAMYQSNLTVNWLKLYGENRACGSAPLPGAGQVPAAGDSAVWYDMGAFGLAFAVHAANLNRNLTGASKLTTRDMWLGTGARGMWREVRAHKVDRVTGWPSSVPEGKGWRKALCSFTGFAHTDAFYAALHAAVAPNGVLATEAQLLAYLESDASIQAQGAMEPNYITPAKKNACFFATPTPAASKSSGNIIIVLAIVVALFALGSRTSRGNSKVGVEQAPPVPPRALAPGATALRF